MSPQLPCKYIHPEAGETCWTRYSSSQPSVSSCRLSLLFLVLGPTNFDPTFGAHHTHFEGQPTMPPKKNTRTYPSDANEVEKPASVDANRKGKVSPLLNPLKPRKSLCTCSSKTLNHSPLNPKSHPFQDDTWPNLSKGLSSGSNTHHLLLALESNKHPL